MNCRLKKVRYIGEGSRGRFLNSCFFCGKFTLRDCKYEGNVIRCCKKCEIEQNKGDTMEKTIKKTIDEAVERVNEKHKDKIDDADKQAQAVIEKVSDEVKKKHGIAVREKGTKKLVGFLKCPTGRRALRILSGRRHNLDREHYYAEEDYVSEKEIETMKQGDTQ